MGLGGINHGKRTNDFILHEIQNCYKLPFFLWYLFVAINFSEVKVMDSLVSTKTKQSLHI